MLHLLTEAHGLVAHFGQARRVQGDVLASSVLLAGLATLASLASLALDSLHGQGFPLGNLHDLDLECHDLYKMQSMSTTDKLYKHLASLSTIAVGCIHKCQDMD